MIHQGTNTQHIHQVAMGGLIICHQGDRHQMAVLLKVCLQVAVLSKVPPKPKDTSVYFVGKYSREVTILRDIIGFTPGTNRFSARSADDRLPSKQPSNITCGIFMA